jgi:hypothetical protein
VDVPSVVNTTVVIGAFNCIALQQLPLLDTL